MTPDHLAEYRDWPTAHEWRRSAVPWELLAAAAVGALALLCAVWGLADLVRGR